MDNIAVFVLTEGHFKPIFIPKDLLLGLIVSLREKGEEQVHLTGGTITVEGIFIPAKDSKTKLIAFPDKEGGYIQ